MTIETIDGIKIFVLPENALCLASDGKSPTDLIDCPVGKTVCNPDGCMNYMEVERE